MVLILKVLVIDFKKVRIFSIISLGGLLVMIGLDKLNLGAKTKQGKSAGNGKITAQTGEA